MSSIKQERVSYVICVVFKCVRTGWLDPPTHHVHLSTPLGNPPTHPKAVRNMYTAPYTICLSWTSTILHKDLLIETSRTVIKRLTNLLGDSWAGCWSFSFMWRFCWFQIRKFHVGYVKAQNLPTIRMPNIKISWNVSQQKRSFCSSLLEGFWAGL